MGSPDDVDVVVVGAGLAGLRAAAELTADGIVTVVLDVRDRVGGRVWSRRAGLADGQCAESGGELVRPGDREVQRLAEVFGVTLAPVTGGRDPRRVLLDHGGRTASLAAVDAATEGALTADLDRWQAALDSVADLVDADDPTAGPWAGDLDRRSVAHLLADLALTPLARLVLGRRLRTEYMVPPAEVSLLHLAWRTAVGRREGDDGRRFRVSGGADALARGLADGLGDRVHLNRPARALTQGADKVEVATPSGAVRAAAAVVTLPLPVLARLPVDPVLPDALFDAGYGRGGKVSLQYERRLWLDQGCDGSVLSDRPVGEVWDASDTQRGDHGLLTAVLSSNDGASFLTLPGVVERVGREIERVFPGAAGWVGRSCRSDWTNDPASLGTFASFGPGQLTRLWPLLSAAHGRVVLAGEHTDPRGASMEGALRSGVRAAAKAKRVLDGPKDPWQPLRSAS